MRWTVLTLFIYTSSFGQIGTEYSKHIDSRDGRVYQTIEIGNTIWIAENMKFKTENSEEHFIDNSKIPFDGYYYPLEEITQVCPDGFRMPNSIEWENYIKLIFQEQSSHESSIDILRLTKKGSDFIIAEISYPYDSLNSLNIKDHGHTQNGQIIALGSFNMWITYEESTDPKYHLHMDDEGFSIHTHKHHIIDKKKKRRKFSIRCVKKG